jgi:hypothetical protein
VTERERLSDCFLTWYLYRCKFSALRFHRVKSQEQAFGAAVKVQGQGAPYAQEKDL